MTSTQHIAVLGTGALGTLIAWHCRSQELFTINRNQQERFSLLEYGASEPTLFSSTSWQGSQVDWLIVTTKAASTLAALKGIESQLPDVKNLLLLQNGMGQQAEVAQWLETQHSAPQLWVGSSTEGAYHAEEGHVVHAGKGHTVIGPWQHECVDQADKLPPSMTLSPDIHKVLKEKLAINAIINPLTAYYQCYNGELLSNADYRHHFDTLSTEVDELFKQLNWNTDFSIPQRAEQVALATAQNRSSTYQDVLHRRPTELPYICGYLLKQAAEHDLSAPLTTELYTSLSATEATWSA
jgi:2-dehydropantoate 2-reductase